MNFSGRSAALSGEVDVPVFMRSERLDEAGALARGLSGGVADEPGGLEHAVSRGRADGGDIAIEHRESEAAVAFEGMSAGEVDDGGPFVGSRPVVAGHVGVVLVGLAVALGPSVELAGGEMQPSQEPSRGQLGQLADASQPVDDEVAQVVRRPALV